MRTSSSSPTANRLLRTLPAVDYRRLSAELEAVNLTADATLFEPNAPAPFAYFPIDSIVMLSYRHDRDSMAKAWSVGREGMVGIALFLDSPDRDSRADVQTAGLAFRLSAAAMRAEFCRGGALHQVLLRYVHALVTQSSQLCICHRYHTVEQRFCNLLTRSFAEAHSEIASLTQGRIGELLGVRRESITEIALRLQRRRASLITAAARSHSSTAGGSTIVPAPATRSSPARPCGGDRAGHMDQ